VRATALCYALFMARSVSTPVKPRARRAISSILPPVRETRHDVPPERINLPSEYLRASSCAGTATYTFMRPERRRDGSRSEGAGDMSRTTTQLVARDGAAEGAYASHKHR